MPGDVLALLELLVDLAGLLLALFEFAARVVGALFAVFRGRGGSRAVLVLLFGDRGAVAVGVLLVLRCFPLFLGRRAAGRVGFEEGVVVDVVAWSSGPRLAIAVLGIFGRVGRSAADFGREGRVEEAWEFTAVAMGEFGGRVEVGDHELVFAVLRQDGLVDDILEGCLEEILGDLAQTGL